MGKIYCLAKSWFPKSPGFARVDCQHWLLLLRKGTVDWHVCHDFNAALTSLHT